MTSTIPRRLPAEWEPQDGVLLAWPHEGTDWRECLDEVEPVFVDIVREVAAFERVLILAPDARMLRDRLQAFGLAGPGITVFEVATNDTWARDFGPITVFDHGRPLVLDFGFNGWGLKFVSCDDNRANRRLHMLGAFGRSLFATIGMILEGGSIDSDGQGTLLTTAQCLLSPNRNPHLSRQEIEAALFLHLGSERCLWLTRGILEGDDTDAHIDTLARLCPDDTIVHVGCDDPADRHYEELAAMAQELAAFRTRDGRPYRLLPLPWPSPKFDEGGCRLPATYANYLVLNDAVLVPTYNDAKDEAALAVLQYAFPGRRITGIGCLPLIRQHGSLHCLTMHLPKGALA